MSVTFNKMRPHWRQGPQYSRLVLFPTLEPHLQVDIALGLLVEKQSVFGSK